MEAARGDKVAGLEEISILRTKRRKVTELKRQCLRRGVRKTS